MTRPESIQPLSEPIGIEATLSALFYGGAMAEKIEASIDSGAYTVETKRLSNFGTTLLGEGNMAGIPILVASGEWYRRPDHIATQIDILIRNAPQTQTDWEMLKNVAMQIVSKGGEIILPHENPEHSAVLAKYTPPAESGLPRIALQTESDLAPFAAHLRKIQDQAEAVLATMWFEHGEILEYAKGLAMSTSASFAEK